MYSRGVFYRLMRKALVPLLIFTLIVLVINVARISITPASAQDEPERIVWITVDSTSHEWWLARWADNTISCQLSLDHDGFPTALDIQNTCGNALYEAWLVTPPCVAAEDGTSTSGCSGFYLQKNTSMDSSTEIEVELPSEDFAQVAWDDKVEIAARIYEAEEQVDALITTTTSGGDGFYEFTDLPADNYLVIVDTTDPNFPATVVQTQDPDETGVCQTCDSHGKATLGLSDDTVDSNAVYVSHGYYWPRMSVSR